MNKKKVLGFTLTELMITIAILGIVASMAVPSFLSMLERNRLKEVAEGLKSDLMWMHTETIKRSCNLQITFTPATWNYTIFRTAGTCGCLAGGGSCTDITVNGSQFTGITMTSPVSLSDGTSALFDFRRGTVSVPNSGNAQLNSSNYSVKVVVSTLGRVRICNIAGSDGLNGYVDC